VKRDEFDALIRKLEAVSHQNPRLYFARVAGLVLLAYGYLGFILLGSLALSIAIVVGVVFVPNALTIKLGLVGLVLFGGLFIAIARGLWIRMEPPTGLVVTREQAPKLFTLLDELRAALDCQPFHRVLLMGEHNAAVVQTPRLGLFGWHRNYLLLGLPLMQSLAPDEFKAVLAHEFAHSSRGHGRFGNWIYRVRRSWERIFEQMARQGSGGGRVLTAFLNWFWPQFNAHAFVLSRANEYEADACSVRLAGADAAANALMRLPVDGEFINEKFWPDIRTQVQHVKEPPANTMIALGQALKAGPSLEDSTRWMRQAFLIETSNADTHPCLKDRLRAMNRLPASFAQGEFPTSRPPTPEINAADFFLEREAEKLAQLLSENWRQDVSPHWAKWHEEARKIATDLAAMEKPSDAPASADELWERAEKLIALHGDSGATPVIEQILALDAHHAAANFVRGRVLLEVDDPRGVTFLETAIASDVMLTPNACELLYAHFNRTGQRDKLRPLEERVDQFQADNALAQQERANITAASTFVFHELIPPQVAELKKVFETEPEVLSVAVVRKVVQHFPKVPCYVIGLRLDVSWWKPRGSTASQKLLNRLLPQIKMPGQFLLFVDEGNLKSLAKKVFAVPGAVIYQRPPKS
jgi:Zn-dependent protease with chaperone function